ncbi:hypothetical protein HKX29_03190 [Sulfitobacter sp. S46]|uniref:hypothetical protein n=1 Tax=unclassified Sulfitobacter TaxID=196795 RepID=UPI0023E2F389|nr:MULTISPECIES: hypothetical protein [unclassified Sulfitobacter]MDF3417347.1 hypothetical protein [Sulfitobacter sp. Ks38]MDF3428410.1 hypothetical protein [Sulfitobacter sp. S46]MDF3443182.1 hypothetical protein [Sulfitobacter sp. KE31]MDF3547207.1 hypothetical protein [Sulfitobacter sp. KE28]|tara:strand:+ start:498 stop:695 length:198 start_codon:yes stop_codon:yes gene_type:complete
MAGSFGSIYKYGERAGESQTVNLCDIVRMSTFEITVSVTVVIVAGGIIGYMAYIVRHAGIGSAPY